LPGTFSATRSGFLGKNPSPRENPKDRTATKIADREVFVFKLAAATGTLPDPMARPE